MGYEYTVGSLGIPSTPNIPGGVKETLIKYLER